MAVAAIRVVNDIVTLGADGVLSGKMPKVDVTASVI